MTSFAFPPAVRLLQASEFKAVFDHALYKVHQPSFMILAIARSSEQTQSRIGIVVAKRKIKRAHERNRFKRLTRDSFRLNQHQLPALDLVIMAKQGADLVPNAELHQELLKGWQMLQSRVRKHLTIASAATPTRT
jgi:ribonuclease P protein component